MQEIMTCESCGCSFTDVDNLDYTEVFTTGLCCECILEENWGNSMKFRAKPLFEEGENKEYFKKEFADFLDKDGYIVGWYVDGKYWNGKV